MSRLLAGISPVLLIAIVLAAPAFLERGFIVKFDRKPLDRLEEESPDVVVMGNSMLFTRLHEEELRKHTGGLRISLLAEPNAFSARWFLWLKNYMVRMEAPPEKAVIFFRDNRLTLPAYKTEGNYSLDLHALMLKDEPEVLEVIGLGPPRLTWRRAPLLQWMYPMVLDRGNTIGNIYNISMDIAAGTGTKRTIKAKMKDQFDLADLRDDLGDDIIEEDEEADFTFQPEQSFLPHILRVAKDSSIQLVFYRVKRRPGEDGVRHESESLVQYMDQLRAYLEDHGAILVDETDDESLVLSMYADGDHIEKKVMRSYTRGWWKRMEPVLAPRAE